jgi:hypothetical protein
MKKIVLLIAALGLMALAVMPAQAFTMQALTVTVAQNGDAQIDMRYDLSFLELTAVFFKIADPAAELKSAFENNGATVTVTSASSAASSLTVSSYADVMTTGSTRTLVTPSLSFEKAQKVLNSYWFAPLITPDFSPAVTTVKFPDGYQAVYYDVISIPSITHTMKG